MSPPPSSSSSASSLLSSLRTRLRAVRRRLLLHRRLLAALCAAGAVLLAVQALAPPPPVTEQVWVAARSLEGGAVLTAAAVEPRALPPDLVPDEAVTDVEEVVGRPLAAPVTRGEPLTRVRVVGPGLATAYPGSRVVPVRFADGDVVDLLRPGDRVDVVAVAADGTGAPQLLTSGAAVVAVPRPGGDATEVGSPGRLVVLAVPAQAASRVAVAAVASVLIPVWSR